MCGKNLTEYLQFLEYFRTGQNAVIDFQMPETLCIARLEAGPEQRSLVH